MILFFENRPNYTFLILLYFFLYFIFLSYFFILFFPKSVIWYFFCKKILLAPSALALIYLSLSISPNYSKPMFILVRLIHNCKLRVNVSFNGMLKVKHDTFPVNWWFDIHLLYLYMGLHLCFVHFRMPPYLFAPS